jgi:hypothetical protein
MKKRPITALIQIMLPAILLMGSAGRAESAAIFINQVTVSYDQVSLTAEVSADLQLLESDVDFFLDGLTVNPLEGSADFAVDDLAAPFGLLLPANGTVSTFLFVLTGLAPFTTG